MTAKFAYQQKMAQIASDEKRVGLEQTKQCQINLKDKHKAVLEGKKESAILSFKKRDESKIADQQCREDAKSKKQRHMPAGSKWCCRKCLGAAASMEVCSQVPDNLQEAHAHQLQLAANALPPAAMPPSGAPLRQMTMTQECDTNGPHTHQMHAAAMPPYAPLHQTTMTQACKDKTFPPTDENLDPDPLVLLPGSQACHG
jgi:hypothetical protein